MRRVGESGCVGGKPLADSAGWAGSGVDSAGWVGRGSGVDSAGRVVVVRG